MLINDVLDMSRIKSNRMSINREPFELFQFLNSFVSVIYPQAAVKGLESTEKTSGFSEHTTYLGDALRLNQILLNLASNAVKFTPSGGKVSLEVTQLPPRGNRSWLRFTVSDTGIGMDEQGLSRLYTPFEQSDVNLSPISAGMLGPLEVLVVDDEQDICEYTTLLLEKMKIHAKWVLSGAEAVKRVVLARECGQDFDVCFIDWKMPEMDGVETTRRIRELVGPDTPIIIISAYDWSDIEQEARAAGVNAFIAKPMLQSSIYNVLVNVTNGAFGMVDTKEKFGGHTLWLAPRPLYTEGIALYILGCHLSL